MILFGIKYADDPFWMEYNIEFKKVKYILNNRDMKEKIRTDQLKKSRKIEDLERRHKEYLEKNEKAGFVLIKDENGKEKQVRFQYNNSEGYNLIVWPVKKISEIEGLREATHLEYLHISGDDITEIEGLDTLTNLK